MLITAHSIELDLEERGARQRRLAASGRVESVLQSAGELCATLACVYAVDVERVAQQLVDVGVWR